MALQFVDTHAHVHFDDYGLDAEATLESAKAKGVTSLILVSKTT